MNSGHLVIAYHGCDITTRDDLVSGRLKHLDHSKNRYDWLGPGSYFFEGDWERALLFAQASHNNPEKRYTAKPIGTPAVVGAVLSVHSCLDMTTQAGIQEFIMAYEPMVRGLESKKTRVPINTAASEDDHDIILRALDNAVFSFIHDARATRNPPLEPFQAVRGAFHQGDEIAPKSGFQKNTHIQIAVRDNSCVVGWFLPPGAELLSDRQYELAKTRLAAMRAVGKPRVRSMASTKR